MLKFNNNNIFTGYIKQILATFNLPKYKVYSKENKDYYTAYHAEKDIIETVKIKATEEYPEHMRYVPYIRDNKIQYYVNKGTSEAPQYIWEDAVNGYPTYFTYNINIPNWTKNLEIKNNIYDSYTHEYLGDYLRFKRDYENIDLMSLYNCFSNRICTSLDYEWTTTDLEQTTTMKFSTQNTNYKIYMLPVKLFKKYTIAIDCNTTVEVCCGIYGKYQDKRTKLANIPKLTYKKFNSLIFGQPKVYDLLTTLSDQLSATATAELAQNEGDLKMFIKLPVSNDSSIVILEGDYRNYNDSVLSYRATKWDTKPYWSSKSEKFYVGALSAFTNIGELHSKLFDPDENKLYTRVGTIDANEWGNAVVVSANGRHYYLGKECPVLNLQSRITAYDVFIKTTGDGTAKNASTGVLYVANNRLIRVQNYTVVNFDKNAVAEVGNSYIKQDFSSFKPISALQLLRVNTKESYPFADRLIEYLTENAITSSTDIIDDIRRVQKVILYNTQNPEIVKENVNNTVVEKKVYLLDSLAPEEEGVWEDVIRPIVYDKLNTTIASNINDINHDILGYVDKDIEAQYKANTGKTDAKGNPIFTTILGVDLYEEEK